MPIQPHALRRIYEEVSLVRISFRFTYTHNNLDQNIAYLMLLQYLIHSTPSCLIWKLDVREQGVITLSLTVNLLLGVNL